MVRQRPGGGGGSVLPPRPRWPPAPERARACSSSAPTSDQTTAGDTRKASRKRSRGPKAHTPTRTVTHAHARSSPSSSRHPVCPRTRHVFLPCPLFPPQARLQTPRGCRNQERFSHRPQADGFFHAGCVSRGPSAPGPSRSGLPCRPPPPPPVHSWWECRALLCSAARGKCGPSSSLRRPLLPRL